jgi:type I restriction enzyme S subunit
MSEENYKRLGDYIQEVDVRNEDDSITNLLGINIDKYYMPSVANVVGTDLSRYKVVEKGQFACNRMHVGRDKRLPVALSTKEDKFIVSPAYDVFEIIDRSEMLPEYLMMWFSRKEFDRNTWFYTDADVRGGLNWNTFLDMQLPIPSPEKQREIVAEYNAVQNRINLNNQLIQKLEETAQAIYKQWFVDFEFPNEEGKPYKSSGGEMVESELGEIPRGWRVDELGEVSVIKAGGDKPNIYSEEKTAKCFIPIYSNGVIDEGLYGYTNTANYPANCITISARGTIGYCKLRGEPFDAIVRLIVVIPKHEYQTNYLYDSIRKFEYNESGSVQSQLTVPEISSFPIIYPDCTTLKKYQENVYFFNENMRLKRIENKKIEELKSLLLSRMARG